MAAASASAPLAELHRVLPIDWLPSSGALLFFYDMKEQPWGFDPKDRGSCAVLHVPDLASPPSPPITAARSESSPIAFRHVGFRRIETLPSLHRDQVRKLYWSFEDSEVYKKACDEPFHGRPRHQVGGFPSAVQSDWMELECQLASNGIYRGDGRAMATPQAKALMPGAADWRLLFQFDSDEDLDVMWGDCGRIYFWVREQDARAANFAGTWLILQCH
jgi:uncharacterized protein YwqG